MAFPTVDWAAVTSPFDTMIQTNGQDASVTLRDGVTTFTVRVVMKKAPPEDVTDGIQQLNNRCQVMASRWQAGAGREPQKGDQLTIDGRIRAIQFSNPVGAGNTVIGYVLVLRG